MVKHIVMLKLKEKTQENLEKMKAAIMGLEGQIEGLQDIEVGFDYLQQPRSYDLVLTATLDDKASLERYAHHPKHMPVLEITGGLSEHTVAVDYEI